MKVPDDFVKELQKDKKAYEFFLSLNRANTYAIAWRLQTAKKPETREKRMSALLEMMRTGEKHVIASHRAILLPLRGEP